MVKEVIENSDKVVTIAERINVGGTLSIIMSLMLLTMFAMGYWLFYKWIRGSMDTMKEMARAGTDLAESNKNLVNANINKDQDYRRQATDFNNVRLSHVEEIKRVNDSAKCVDFAVKHLEVQISDVAMDVKEIKAYIKIK